MFKTQSVNQQDAKKAIGHHNHNTTQLISTMSQFISQCVICLWWKDASAELETCPQHFFQ